MDLKIRPSWLTQCSVLSILACEMDTKICTLWIWCGDYFSYSGIPFCYKKFRVTYKDTEDRFKWYKNKRGKRSKGENNRSENETKNHTP